MKNVMSDFFDFKKLVPVALEKYMLSREARAGRVCARFRILAEELIPLGNGNFDNATISEATLKDLKKEVGEIVKPKYFKGGTLYVSVPSSIWAQRVFVHRHQLITRLNEELGDSEVKEIRTVVEM